MKNEIESYVEVLEKAMDELQSYIDEKIGIGSGVTYLGVRCMVVSTRDHNIPSIKLRYKDKNDVLRDLELSYTETKYLADIHKKQA